LKLPNCPKIANAQQIVDLRNYIIHSYDNINDITIWGIIVNHLPNLHKEVTDLLDK